MAKYQTMKIFKGDKPLMRSVSYYPDRFFLKYNKFELPKEFDLYSCMKGKRVELGDKKIVFGIAARPEEFCEFDFLECPDGFAFVVHSRVLEIFKKECPEDIQELPITIKNLNPKSEPFENNDFWLINLLNKIDIVDYEKSEVEIISNGSKRYKKVYFRDVSSMNGHKLILGAGTRIVFAPSLAKYFVKSKGIKFFTDRQFLEQIYTLEALDRKPKLQKVNKCGKCGNIRLTLAATLCLSCGETTPINITEDWV